MKLPQFEGKVECPQCGELADVRGDFDGKMLSVVGSPTAHMSVRLTNVTASCPECGFEWGQSRRTSSDRGVQE